MGLADTNEYLASVRAAVGAAVGRASALQVKVAAQLEVSRRLRDFSSELRRQAENRRAETWTICTEPWDPLGAMPQAEPSRLRAGEPQSPIRESRRFSIEGVVGDQQVRASWDDGVLYCDEPLLTLASVVVALGETFAIGEPPREVTATLDGPPSVVMLTLARACNRITAVTLGLP